VRLTFTGVVIAGLVTSVAILGLDRAGGLRDRPAPAQTAAPVSPPRPAPAPIVAAAPRFVTDERPEELPPGEHRELVFYACTACHGFKIVNQQGQTKQQWDSTIDFMIERHKMPVPSAVDRAAMVEYLAASFPQRRRAPANPFLR
jgi:hypothetical protein